MLTVAVVFPSVSELFHRFLLLGVWNVEADTKQPGERTRRHQSGHCQNHGGVQRTRRTNTFHMALHVSFVLLDSCKECICHFISLYHIRFHDASLYFTAFIDI